MRAHTRLPVRACPAHLRLLRVILVLAVDVGAAEHAHVEDDGLRERRQIVTFGEARGVDRARALKG